MSNTVSSLVIVSAIGLLSFGPAAAAEPLQPVATITPLAGPPAVRLPAVVGASPDKPFLMRVPVMGRRPVTITVDGLPSGLRLETNRVVGTCGAGVYPVVVRAVNAEGRDEKRVRLVVRPDGTLRTPLLGFTTWNAFGSEVSQKDILRTADYLVESGLAECGYAYVNLDSGWQSVYGGPFDAIQPNAKFPDMKAMYDHLHGLGLKGGIYSTPMLQAWGCPKEFKSIPGCTRGEADDRFAPNMTGIGKDRCERNNVRQWAAWGVDYLKYDWDPTDPVNADLMKRELLACPRQIDFCVTVRANPLYARYWTRNCCSFRDNGDTRDEWGSVMARFGTLAAWEKIVCPGHFYDLDMLALGSTVWNNGKTRFNGNEEQAAFTLHAFVPSPIQLSCRLWELTPREVNLVANDEILAINQDVLCDFPRLVREEKGAGRNFRVYRRELAGERAALAVFNLGDAVLTESFPLGARFRVRDAWTKTDLGVREAVDLKVLPHAAAVFVLASVPPDK